MKRLMILAASVSVVATAGCSATRPTVETRRRPPINSWIVTSAYDTAIENAIVAQHTLFGYQFVPNAAALNEIGKRDLSVLAAHHKKHPGELSVRRGDITAELYAARVETVVETLAQAGVETDRITILDALPGGEGMPSERFLVILKNRDKPISQSDTRQSTGAGS